MSIYPEVALDEGHGFPASDDFLVTQREDGKGKAVYTLTGHARGELVARFTGLIVPYRTQHSLQLNPNLHVLDLHFAGYLAHSCSPNVFVDMQEFEIWALQDIPPDSILSMDYASTEDELYKQFACLCDSPCCRDWITGRKEAVNAEGLVHLQNLAHERQVLACELPLRGALLSEGVLASPSHGHDGNGHNGNGHNGNGHHGNGHDGKGRASRRSRGR